MKIDELINEYGIEFAIEKILRIINEKLDEYGKTKDKKIQKEIQELLEDRDKIYSNDKETIKKYLEKR